MWTYVRDDGSPCPEGADGLSDIWSLEFHCFDEFLWVKSRETIGLKGVAALYDEYIAMIKGRKAQGSSVEQTERDKLQH